MEHGKAQCTILIALKNDKYGIKYSEEKRSGFSHCLSNHTNYDEIINMIGTCHLDENWKVVCAKMRQPVKEIMIIVVSKTK